MDYQKVKVNARQATSIHKYKNLRQKLLQCNANIFFNKQCLIHKVTPTYAKIHIPYTSPASITSQRKTQLLRIKEEIRFLYKKKEHLNKELYKAHLQAATEWGSLWHIIQNSIADSSRTPMDRKYKTMKQKIDKLAEQNTANTKQKHTFYPRVINNTNIQFTPYEENIMQKGLKYNINQKPKNWINTLAIEAETALTLLPPQHQDPMRFLIARNIESLYKKQSNQQANKLQLSLRNELKTIKEINKKLKDNGAIVTKSDKGNSMIIFYLHDYDTKVQNFIDSNNFNIEPTDPTKKYQAEIRKVLNHCTQTVTKNQIWKYVNMNPSPPTLKGLPKIHKTNIPIRPIINWRNAPAYHLAKLISDTITKEIPLPNTFNVKNTVQLTQDLQEISISEHIHLASFDIKDMYTNIPTKTLPQILKLACNQTQTPKKLQHELITLLRTVLKQNYFQYKQQIYKQNTGLAMGAPSSSILSELFLQYIEHTKIYDILNKHSILGYFRYVDDILLVYDITVTNINTVLDEFNNVAQPMFFTMEKEVNNQLNFLDITVKKANNSLHFEIYRKPTSTDIIIPHESNHPIEHKISAIRYLQDRNNTYPTTTNSKQKEQHIITQILQNNHYDHDILKKPKYKKHNGEENTKKRWAKFTYTGKETRYITKLFRKSNIGIAYTTRDNLRHLLHHRQTNTTQNTYNRNGVYKLTCTECDKQYIGQTGRPFHVRYKEHAREYKYASNKSNYAKHLLDNKHTMEPIEKCMTVLHTTRKGPLLNALERFYIYHATQNDTQLNDKSTVTPNPIFDTIIKHSQNETPRFRTY